MMGLFKIDHIADRSHAPTHNDFTNPRSDALACWMVAVDWRLRISPGETTLAATGTPGSQRTPGFKENR